MNNIREQKEQERNRSKKTKKVFENKSKNKDKKKTIESSLPIPSGAEIKYIYKTYGSLLSHKINSSMQYILDKLHIPLKWNKYYTIICLIILIIIPVI